MDSFKFNFVPVGAVLEVSLGLDDLGVVDALGGEDGHLVRVQRDLLLRL